MNKYFFFFLVAVFFLQGEVQDSVIPLLEKISLKQLCEKMNKNQINNINKAKPYENKKLRVMTYNMLFNLPCAEKGLGSIYHWKQRLPRIVEYLKFSQPDIIGSQELYVDQLQDLMKHFSKVYDCCKATRKEKNTGETQAIFYKKSKLDLIDCKTFFMTKDNKVNNTLVYAKFKDKKTKKEFIVLNTHLSFSNIKKRLSEARFIRKIIQSFPKNLPVVLTGDFNTFPNRIDMDLPFYDGDNIVKILTNCRMYDSRQRALLGHIGPVTTTNFDEKTKKNFSGKGVPGVFLDRIFVSSQVMVWVHAIDPAKVNGYFGSDHYPVLAEVILP